MHYGQNRRQSNHGWQQQFRLLSNVRQWRILGDHQILEANTSIDPCFTLPWREMPFYIVFDSMSLHCFLTGHDKCPGHISTKHQWHHPSRRLKRSESFYFGSNPSADSVGAVEMEPVAAPEQATEPDLTAYRWFTPDFLAGSHHSIPI